MMSSCEGNYNHLDFNCVNCEDSLKCFTRRGRAGEFETASIKVKVTDKFFVVRVPGMSFIFRKAHDFEEIKRLVKIVNKQINKYGYDLSCISIK